MAGLEVSRSPIGFFSSGSMLLQLNFFLVHPLVCIQVSYVDCGFVLYFLLRLKAVTFQDIKGGEAKTRPPKTFYILNLKYFT